MKQYDVVIIGSGLGGLLTGALLSKEGYSVCIVEKNPVFGGSLQTFKRDGEIFDTGMHYFGSIDKGQFIYKLFKYLGIFDGLNLKRLDVDGFDLINFNNKEYKFAQGFDNFIDKLSPGFPNEKENITRFINRIKEIGSSENMFNLNSDSRHDSFRISPYYSQNAYKEVCSITSDPGLQNVLGGLNDLIGAGKDKTNMFTFGMTYYSYLESAWRFKGGASQLTNALVAKIEQAGSTLIKNTEVNEIVLDDNKNVVFVKTNKQTSIKGKYFISNIHPQNTNKLLPKNALRKVYVDRISRLENSTSVFSTYLVLKKHMFKYRNYNYFDFLSTSTWNNNNSNTNSWPLAYWLATQVPEGNDEFATAAVLLAPIGHRQFDKWIGTTVGKRGSDYEDLKTGFAEKLLEKVFIRFPELKPAIKKYYTASPLSYRDYIGSPDGSAYGLIKDSENPIGTIVLPKTHIRNLFLTGQNINSHGMLGVSTGSLVTISYLSDIRKIIEKIALQE
jgi:all-trans-retinol 13,14-reductase